MVIKMIKELEDYAYPNMNIVSEEEELFKKRIKERLGFGVTQTLYIRTVHKQSFLYVWCDFPEECNIVCYEGGTPYADSVYDSEYIKSCYGECFGLDEEEWQNIYLTVKDFRKSLIAYAYGHSIAELKEAIQKFRDSKDYRVLLDYNTLTFIILCELGEYIYMNSRKAKLERMCFDILKRHDAHNIIETSDIRLNIVLHTKSNGKKLNGVLMTNRGL